jgi:porin
VLAAPPPISTPAPETSTPGQTPDLTPGASAESSGFFTGIEHRGYLLGDMGGLRSFLGQFGMTFALQETSEVLGNLTGGVRQGFEYDGLTQMVLQLDTQRAFGWYGGTFNASAFQIHGRSVSADNLDTLQTASGIEADRATRLWELWYQQKLLDQDRLDIKVGQQSLDQEFIVNQNAALFVNTMFGWPMLPSADLPGGGPAYPLSALGVRVRARPVPSVTILAGVFNGSPAPNNIGDPQQQNPSGTSFPVNGGTLAIAELQYAYPSLGGMVSANGAEPLARVYKIGMWYDTESFADQSIDNTGLALANPYSTGIPQQHRGDYAIYAVADQIIWQSDEDEGGSLSVFGRALGAPEENRNLIDFSMNAGLTLHAPFEGRFDDTAGIGMGYAHVSSGAAAADSNIALYTGSFTPVRSGETYLEVTYQYQATPWWQIQPDFQYVFNPGAGIANVNDPTERVKDEAVLGVRTNIAF